MNVTNKNGTQTLFFSSTTPTSYGSAIDYSLGCAGGGSSNCIGGAGGGGEYVETVCAQSANGTSYTPDSTTPGKCDASASTQPPPLMNITYPIPYADYPTDQPITVTGWAIDQADAISEVDVSLTPGSGGANPATYGVAYVATPNNPNPCDANPGFFSCSPDPSKVGFTFTFTPSPGFQQITVTAYNSDSPVRKVYSKTITITVGTNNPSQSGQFGPVADCTGPANASCYPSPYLTWQTSGVTATELVVTGSNPQDLINQPFKGAYADSIPIGTTGGADTYDLYDYSSGVRGNHLAGPATSHAYIEPQDGTCASPPSGDVYSAAPQPPYCAPEGGLFSGSVDSNGVLTGPAPWTWQCLSEYGSTAPPASCSATSPSSGGSCSVENRVLTVAATQGDAPQAKTVTITNTSNDDVTATVRDSGLPSWLTVDKQTAIVPANGSATFTFTFSADTVVAQTYPDTTKPSEYFYINLTNGTAPGCNESNDSNVAVIATIAVQPKVSSVQSISATPKNVTIKVGVSQTFTVTETYSDKSSAPVSGFWDPTQFDGIVSYTGSNTFTGVKAGQVQLVVCSPNDKTVCDSQPVTITVTNPQGSGQPTLAVAPSQTVWVGTPVTVTASGGTGSYKSPWGVSNSGVFSGSTLSSSGGDTNNVFSATASTAGTTNVTVIDSNDASTSTTVTVVQPNCNKFTATPSTIIPPTQVKLLWQCGVNTPPLTCSISWPGHPSMSEPESGYIYDAPIVDTTYTLTCQGGSDIVPYQAKVKVTGAGIIEVNP